jgi:hypothetical protein
MSRYLLPCTILVILPAMVQADPPQIDRSIGKEPVYKTKNPRYALLALGPEGKDRVWLAWDGDTLYCDRNGNGDLTDPGEKLAAKKPRPGVPQEEGSFDFDIGDLTFGGRMHKNVGVSIRRLSYYQGSSIAKRPDVKAALAKDPNAQILTVSSGVDVPGLKGGGIGGRLSFMAGFYDLNGLLQFAAKPADASVIRLGGPLEVTFFAELPSLRVDRDSELVLVVGTSGIGPGTFAMLSYMDTIPEDRKPVAEITYQPSKRGEKPFKELFEIKGRC